MSVTGCRCGRNVKVDDLEREYTREGRDISWFDEGYPDPAGAANPDRDRILRAAVKNDFPVNVLFWDRMLAGGPKGRTH